MEIQDFLGNMKSRGAFLAPPPSPSQTSVTNINLQKIHAAMLPSYMLNIYNICGGIILDSGYILGPAEFRHKNQHPVPSIFQINQNMSNLSEVYGKTIFGINDLFFFAFDSFGNCTMMDKQNLAILRKYDNVFRAMTDCLMGGKF